jgi:protein-disulfide isomerase
MGRRKQNPSKGTRESEQAQATERSGHTRALWAGVGTSVALLACAVAATFVLLSHTNSRAAAEEQIKHEVSALLAGIPQQERTLGSPTAPVTLQVFLDLKDPDSRFWFLHHLPAIIHDHVRTGALKLEYRAYKTNTFSPQTFVKAQTAALAAGAQNKLWNYIETFYHEQGNEFVKYVSDPYLENIARQIPGLNLAHWRTARHTGRREEQTTSEDRTARALGLHVTPSFRIGRTGGAMHNFSGHAVIKYKEQHPIALPDTGDIGQAIWELRSR